MPDIFGIVIAKAAAVAVFSLVASFGISALVVPILGGRLEGAGLIMTLTLPVVISFPASILQFWQFETTRRLKDELSTALVQLDDVNAKLVSTNLELIRERSHDPLTRLLTEDIFRERLVSQPNMADIGQLVRVRLDGLLELRKAAGSAAAETAIFTVAAAIRRSLRPIDYAGRIGDHEFAIFMPGSTPILASLAVGSISSTVAAILFQMDGKAAPVTVSAGGIECAPGFDIAEALAAATAELEKSTAQGGNCSHWGKLRLESAFARSVT
jgi:GGDEF domain-containing protein